MDMSGVLIKIPNMQNGRCFVSSKALSEATLEQVKSQMLVRRNETGVPILESGIIDGPRHDWELKMAQEAAETIIGKIIAADSNECCQRLRLGHVLEEDDVELISRVMNFRLQVACSDDAAKPFYEVNSGDPESNRSKKTYRFVLSGKNLRDAHHWEAVILVPRGQLLGVCREVLQLKFQVPHTTDREVYDLKSEVSTLERKLRQSKNICRNLVARVQQLEEQQTEINKNCKYIKDRFDNLPQKPQKPQNVKQPPSAFVLFRSSIKGELVGEGGHAVAGNEAASRRWKDLSEEQKQPFIDEAQLRRSAYYEAKRQGGAA